MYFRFFMGVKNVLEKIKDSCTNNNVCNILCIVLISAIISVIVNKLMSGGNVEKQVKKTITNDPRFIIDAIEKMYQNERKEAQEKMAKKAPEVAKKLQESKNPYLGKKNGSKIVVEFFDYACGHCKREATELVKLVKGDKDVKVILADLPIMTKNSLDAAQLGIYISLKNAGKFEKYYTMVSQKNVDPASLKMIVKALGLPENYITKSKNDKDVKNILQANYNYAREIGLQGTPALIVNGKFLPGAVSADDLKDMLK